MALQTTPSALSTLARKGGEHNNNPTKGAFACTSLCHAVLPIFAALSTTSNFEWTSLAVAGGRTPICLSSPQIAYQVRTLFQKLIIRFMNLKHVAAEGGLI